MGGGGLQQYRNILWNQSECLVDANIAIFLLQNTNLANQLSSAAW